MAELLKLYNTALQPASNAQLDLGSDTYEWNSIWIDGIAYIDALEMHGNIEMLDHNIISMGIIYGVSSNNYIDMSTDGRLSIMANALGDPFNTPDISISGSIYHDANVGIAGTNQLQFRDTAIYINSGTDGHLDLVADTSIDLNADIDISTKNIITDTSTGTKIGTATTQKLGFFNATPIVQPINTTDLRQLLIDLGLLATGGANPLDLNGGLLKVNGYHCNISTVDVNYTVDVNDDVILVDATSPASGETNITITLPEATTCTGKVLEIKALEIASAGNVTIEPSGSGETIDTASSYVITTEYAKVKLASNGSNWYVL